MADEEHLRILQQGIEKWNIWKETYRERQADLSHADLNGADLRGANFNNTLLNKAKLSHANLSHANLSNSHLWGINLTEANLSWASLGGTILNAARLIDANLSHADLSWTIFINANLSRANLSGATMGWTTLGELDLREVKGLETIQHQGPSHLSINTIYKSEGDIPEVFVRGTGAPESFIEYMHALAAKPIQYYTCFISYSNKDQGFAERLYADLQNKGVRCWFALEDMKTGDKIRHRIDTSIRLYDKLLLILSEASVASQWVEHEVETAIGKELEGRANVLFPVCLDDAVMQSTVGWASHIKLTRHITDFSQWKHHDAYQKSLDRLLRDLKADTAR